MKVLDVKLQKGIGEKIFLGIKSDNNKNITKDNIKGLKSEQIVDEECKDETVLQSFGTDYKVFHLTEKYNLHKRLEFKIEEQTVSYIPSKMLAYGNIEVMGVDIKGLYDSTSSRVLALGQIDSDNIKDEKIQEVLESLNINGLEGHFGCDINGMENSKLFFIDLKQSNGTEKITKLHKEYSQLVKENKEENKENIKKLAKRILTLANNLLSIDEYKNNPENHKVNEKNLEEIKKEMENSLDNKQEPNIFQTLGIKFKQASILYYSGDDTNVAFDKLITGMTTDIKDLSKTIPFDKESLAALPEPKTEKKTGIIDA